MYNFNFLFKDIKNKWIGRYCLWQFACLSLEHEFRRSLRQGLFDSARRIYRRFAFKTWDCIHASDQTHHWKFGILVSFRLLVSGKKIGRFWISTLSITCIDYIIYLFHAYYSQAYLYHTLPIIFYPRTMRFGCQL